MKIIALSLFISLILITGCTQLSTSKCGTNGELCVCGTESGKGCAPEDKRVDLYTPKFSNPAKITNPLFPASEVDQTLLLGHVEGEPLRVVYTLMPQTRKITWNGQEVETRAVQYVAHVDRKIVEFAVDWYAQADDGSVWYFGEDVYNYEEGVVADTHGTWLAGRDGPLSMIMPATPKVGDVYRVENIPGSVFEEITVKQVDLTFEGPEGPVKGAMVGRQLHVEGEYSDKIFAPSYGEFHTSNDLELEAVALAVPTDASTGTMPTKYKVLSEGAISIFDMAESENWSAISETAEGMTSAWDTKEAGDIPNKYLDAQMTTAMKDLAEDVEAQVATDARQAAIDVAVASLDFQMRYRPTYEVDLERLEISTLQLIVSAEEEDIGAVKGDITTMGYIRDRIRHKLSEAAFIDSKLQDLSNAANAEDFDAVLNATEQLRSHLS